MRKNTIIFVLVIIAACITVFIGFVWYATASIPFQDPEFVPASAFEKQAKDLLVGKIMMLIGAVVLIYSIFWRLIISRRIK